MSVHQLETGWDPESTPEGDNLPAMLEQVPDVSYRMLDFWTRVGLLHPTQPARGSGTQRIWAPGEADVVARVLPLTRAGIGLRTAFELARDGQCSLDPAGLLVYDPGAQYTVARRAER
jgi:hypothetical protein